VFGAKAEERCVVHPCRAHDLAGVHQAGRIEQVLDLLEGARQAHETIVRAYAAGDRETLKPLLTPTVMASFEAGIAARETRGETEVAEFLHPARADLEQASAEENRATAKVRFLAELRNTITTADAAAEPQIEERRVAELWTFERTLGASDPNWVLARTEPAAA
jgi:predicted lipid-binding transport protein (Tim44 family)